LLIVVSGLSSYSSHINKFIFDKKHISSENDKKWLAKTLGLWIGIYLFGLTTLVMISRVFTAKFIPNASKDPMFIDILNRIITNTMEQTMIFIGLFIPLFLSDTN